MATSDMATPHGLGDATLQNSAGGPEVLQSQDATKDLGQLHPAGSIMDASAIRPFDEGIPGRITAWCTIAVLRYSAHQVVSGGVEGSWR